MTEDEYRWDAWLCFWWDLGLHLALRHRLGLPVNGPHRAFAVPEPRLIVMAPKDIC